MSEYCCNKNETPLPNQPLYKNCCNIRPSKPATTVLSKNYYTTYNDYLKRKCLTYDTQLRHYDGTGNTYRSSSCCDKKCIVYKVNNPKFGRQGAVSSSTRLLQLKYDTNIRGEGKYPSYPIPSNLVNPTKCVPYHKPNRKLRCLLYW